MQKRMVSVLLVVCMLATSLLSLTACGQIGATAASVGKAALKPASIIYGDVDNDVDVTMKDVLSLRKFISKLPGSINEDAADVSGDGEIDMKDVLLIRKFIAQVITEFPAQATKTTKPQATTTEATTTTTSTTTTTTPTTPTTFINQEDPTINFIDGDETLGVWWWHDVGYNTDREKQYLDLLQKNHFTEIYFYSYTKVKSATERAKLHDFVQRALARGMRVSILFDDIAVAENSYGGEWNSTISGCVSYKQEYPGDTSFYGVHCDIEPRASEYNLRNYVTYFIPKIREARAKGIQVEVDLNCGWYSWGRDLSYDGVTGIYNIIAANVDTMCLMSYDETAGGIIGMSYYPLEAAKKAGTKVVFGIELGNSGEGDKVDFSGESKYEAYYQLYLVDLRLKNQGLEIPYGYAIHHMRAYYALRNLPAEGF